MIKWIAAFIGYFLFRFPGAVLGFIVGTFLDNLGGSGSRPRSVFENVTRQSVSPADFELNLLSLCSIIIKADGQVNQRELDYVRQYFLSTYGKEKANAIFRTFNEVIKTGKFPHKGFAILWCSAPDTRYACKCFTFYLGLLSPMDR